MLPTPHRGLGTRQKALSCTVGWSLSTRPREAYSSNEPRAHSSAPADTHPLRRVHTRRSDFPAFRSDCDRRARGVSPASSRTRAVPVAEARRRSSSLVSHSPTSARRRCEQAVHCLETDWAPVSLVSTAGGGAPDRAGRHERPGPVRAARPPRRGAIRAGRDGLSGHGDRAALGKGTATQGPEGSPIGRGQPPAGRQIRFRSNSSSLREPRQECCDRSTGLREGPT